MTERDYNKLFPIHWNEPPNKRQFVAIMVVWTLTVGAILIFL